MRGLRIWAETMTGTGAPTAVRTRVAAFFDAARRALSTREMLFVCCLACQPGVEKGGPPPRLCSRRSHLSRHGSQRSGRRASMRALCTFPQRCALVLSTRQRKGAATVQESRFTVDALNAPIAAVSIRKHFHQIAGWKHEGTSEYPVERSRAMVRDSR